MPVGCVYKHRLGGKGKESNSIIDKYMQKRQHDSAPAIIKPYYAVIPTILCEKMTYYNQNMNPQSLKTLPHTQKKTNYCLGTVVLADPSRLSFVTVKR